MTEDSSLRPASAKLRFKGDKPTKIEKKKKRKNQSTEEQAKKGEAVMAKANEEARAVENPCDVKHNRERAASPPRKTETELRFQELQRQRVRFSSLRHFRKTSYTDVRYSGPSKKSARARKPTKSGSKNSTNASRLRRTITICPRSGRDKDWGVLGKIRTRLHGGCCNRLDDERSL